jgi:hypothetical protein
MLLKDLGVMSDDVSFLSKLVRDSMELQAQAALNSDEDQEFDVMKPLQVNLFVQTYLGRDKWKYTKQFNCIQVRVTDLVQDNGNTAQKLAQEQTFSISRPDIPLISTSDRIQLSGMVETDTGLSPDDVESDDGVKYCRLDVDDQLEEEMLDRSMKN